MACPFSARQTSDPADSAAIRREPSSQRSSSTRAASAAACRVGPVGRCEVASNLPRSVSTASAAAVSRAWISSSCPPSTQSATSARARQARAAAPRSVPAWRGGHTSMTATIATPAARHHPASRDPTTDIGAGSDTGSTKGRMAAVAAPAK